MLNLKIDKWIKHDARISKGRSTYYGETDSSQLVAGRCYLNNLKKGMTARLRFLIGKCVMQLLEFKKGNFVEIYLHKKNENLILIKKSLPDCDRPHKISHAIGSKFFTVDISLPDPFRKFITDKTIALNYDISDQKILFIDLSKIKRK